MHNFPTGTQINYYAICHRKLWLFSHGVEMERENENVQLGKLAGESSYSRQKKEVSIDDRIVLDWIEPKVLPDGTLLIHEIKKSRAMDAAHRLQVLYYLYYLRQKGVEARGEIDYPLLKRTEAVELTIESEKEVLAAVQGVAHILEQNEAPPRLTRKKLCEKCAYFELCWS